MDLSTAPTCRIFQSVARSSVHCMDDWIVHFWSSSMDNVYGRYMGLCEPCVAKSLADLLYTSRLPKVIPHVNFWVAHVILPTLLRRLHFSTVSPRVTRWMDGVASLSTLCHVSFPEWVMSLRCPYFWALYIYKYILSLTPHISQNFLPANSSKILV